MSIKTFKPTTPSRRHMTVNGFDGIDKHVKPEASLTEVLKKNAGRNSYGRITVRHRGGGNKRKYRIIDFPLSNCVNSDIDTVGILTQYQPLVLNEYIGNGQPWDLDRLHGGVHVLPPYQQAPALTGTRARPTPSIRTCPSLTAMTQVCHHPVRRPDLQAGLL